MKELIFSRIKEIEALKISNKKEPSYALLTEILLEFGSDARGFLNELYKEGRIKTGDTINDKYITINFEYEKTSN